MLSYASMRFSVERMVSTSRKVPLHCCLHDAREYFNAAGRKILVHDERRMRRKEMEKLEGARCGGIHPRALREDLDEANVLTMYAGNVHP